MKKKSKLYLHQPQGDSTPALHRNYDQAFRVAPAYRAALPDMMDAADAIQGANVPIQQVGVSNFRLPLKYAVRRGAPVTLETNVTGSVSVAVDVKGINMSRIVRCFYDHQERTFSPDTLKRVLTDYRRKLGSADARLRLDFSYPIAQRSLRSGLTGHQYYEVAYEGLLDREGRFRKFIHFDFVYSSACPCSAELGEHARAERGVYSIPHSQRSKARVSVEVAPGKRLAPEDLQKHCLNALHTETQVMVKREDEQAFAELNGAYIKFVEDAARLVYEQLAADSRIADFQVACAHLESLHSHDAVAVIGKGIPGGFDASFTDFRSLIC